MPMLTSTERQTLNQREVAQLLGVSPLTLRSWIRKGRFPKPLKIGLRRLHWPRSLIEAMLQEQELKQMSTGARTFRTTGKG
jgi:predicted DNA-binding transcriptional regulator AlpA